jgi:hypothetical protein
MLGVDPQQHIKERRQWEDRLTSLRDSARLPISGRLLTDLEVVAERLY